MAYVELDELKNYLKVTNDESNEALSVALNSAEAFIDDYCGRSFTVPTTATAKQFRADKATELFVPDIANDTDFAISVDGVAWSSTDWQLERYSEDRPYHLIRAIGNHWFTKPVYGEYNIEVTARWGWAAVPAQVVQATYIEAARQFKRKFSPEGVITNEGWAIALRVSGTDPYVARLLAPFRRKYPHGWQ